MSLGFIIIAVLITAGAVAALTLRNLVHCALSLAISLAGLAVLYLVLHAQFVGFAQLLVYVGAVAILIVFAILLTRGSEPAAESRFSAGWGWGVGIAGLVFAVLGLAILSSRLLPTGAPALVDASVRSIGDKLMTTYVLPLQAAGLLLTAALIGAVILAMNEKDSR